MNEALILRAAEKRRRAIADQAAAGRIIGGELLRCQHAGETINVAEVAKIADVERATVYAWLARARLLESRAEEAQR